jgi:hypothetical protein
MPQLGSAAPHPLLGVPQLAPSCEHVVGWQHWLPLQTLPLTQLFGQVPPHASGPHDRPLQAQLMVPVQPSDAVAHDAPPGQDVRGTHAHVPQLSVPPQPSEPVPQLRPSAAHVVGTQAGGTVSTLSTRSSFASYAY